MRQAIEETRKASTNHGGLFEIEDWNWDMLKRGYKLLPNELDSVGKLQEELYFERVELDVSFISLVEELVEEACLNGLGFVRPGSKI